MNDTAYASLRSNVSFLGRLLGDTVAAAQGQPFLDLIEKIRQLSKSARKGTAGARAELQDLLRNLDNGQLVPVARAFSQFLNLANIADQHHNVSRETDTLLSASRSLATSLGELLEEGIAPTAVVDAVRDLKIELVLTAHPTEITRRTLIHKHREIGRCLAQLEQGRPVSFNIRSGGIRIDIGQSHFALTKGSGTEQWSLSDLRGLDVDKGFVILTSEKFQNSGWLGRLFGSGQIRFQYDSLPNARVFFLLFEHLLG